MWGTAACHHSFPVPPCPSQCPLGSLSPRHKSHCCSSRCEQSLMSLQLRHDALREIVVPFYSHPPSSGTWACLEQEVLENLELTPEPVLQGPWNSGSCWSCGNLTWLMASYSSSSAASVLPCPDVKPVPGSGAAASPGASLCAIGSVSFPMVLARVDTAASPPCTCGACHSHGYF